MSHELLFTSVPPGVIPGKRGYCTVARTAELPDWMALLLEQNLSDYRYTSRGNPAVVWAHLRVREFSVLSRKTPVDDHTGRASVFAHHVVLDPDEQPAGGPAWVMGQAGFLLPAWDGCVGTIPAGRQPVAGNRKPRRCLAWEQAGVDPGWAGALAEAFLDTPDRPSYLIAPHDWDLLPLVEDALALVPAQRRWAVSFSTNFTGLPPNVACAWRFVLPDSAEARQAAQAARGGLVVDLRAPGEPKEGALVECARTGNRPPPLPERASAAIPTAVSRRPGKAAAGADDRDVVPLTPWDDLKDVDDLDDLASRASSGARFQLLAIGAVASLILILGVFVIWFIGRGDEPILEPEPDVVAEAPTAEAPTTAPAKTDEGELAPPPPKPEPPKEAPKPVAKAEPPPEPDPATAPTRETRTASALLPDAPRNSTSNPSETALEVPLPAARRFSLRMRGLDDQEMKKYYLSARPTTPNRGDVDALTIVHAPPGGATNLGITSGPRNLAFFRVDQGKLHFRWDGNLGAAASAVPALRDCILEIRGGGTKINLTLRPAVNDPNPMTVKNGQRKIDWGPGGKPARPLLIQTCEVSEEGQGWRNVPTTGNSARWELGNDRPPGSALMLTLVENQDLFPKFEPPLVKLWDELPRLEQKWTWGGRETLANIDGSVSGWNDEILWINAAIDKLRKAGTNPQVQLELADLDSRARNLKNRVKLAERDRARIVQLRRTIPLLDALKDRSIRVKLGMIVDGETIEIGRIGPWQSSGDDPRDSMAR